MKILTNTILITLISFFSFTCKTSTEPEIPEILLPYMTIDIGDLRQYIDTSSGIYFQWEVLDTLTRKDGQKIFSVEESFLSSDGDLYKATNHYFIKDNFFYSTFYDSVVSKLDNYKFIDSKIAEIYPQKNDYFLSTEGVNDSAQVHFKVNFIDSLNTQCGKFNKVAEYEKIDNDNTRSQSIFYAPVFGHIGSTIRNKNGEANIFAIYIKTHGKEIGKYVQLGSQKTYNKKSNKYLNDSRIKKDLFY